jgi:hypothetical protein
MPSLLLRLGGGKPLRLDGRRKRLALDGLLVGSLRQLSTGQRTSRDRLALTRRAGSGWLLAHFFFGSFFFASAFAIVP